jgi:hypothetical protein
LQSSFPLLLFNIRKKEGFRTDLLGLRGVHKMRPLPEFKEANSCGVLIGIDEVFSLGRKSLFLTEPQPSCFEKKILNCHLFS